MKTEEKINKLVAACNRSDLTLFVGAGVSRCYGFDSWETLVDRFAEKLNKAKGPHGWSSEEYLSIPQMFFNSKGKKEYLEIVRDSIDGKESMPGQIHRLMMALEPRHFVTTNYDYLIETAAADAYKVYEVVAADSEVPKLNGQKCILKIHGDLKHKHFVLKEQDYLDYSDNFKLIETVLKSIFASSTVVFVGYSLGDYNVKLILNWVRTLLKDEFPRPFFLYDGDEELGEQEYDYQESRGLNIIDIHDILGQTTITASYEERYRAFFEKLVNDNGISLSQYDKQKAFEFLFEKLSPLNKLPSIRVSDLREVLGKWATMGEDGIINTLLSKNSVLFEYFAEIADTEASAEPYTRGILLKYKTIAEVLDKAHIRGVKKPNSHNWIWTNKANTAISFVDEDLIMLDYKAIFYYTKRKFTRYEALYKKAYSLAQLGMYVDAFNIYSTVAVASNTEGDHLYFYLSVLNRFRCYKCMDAEQKKSVQEETVILDKFSEQEFFASLPYEFQSQFPFLKNIYSKDELYPLQSKAYESALKLAEIRDSYTIEVNYTSVHKLLDLLYQQLEFYVSNQIIVDGLAEFHKAVLVSMKALIQKFSLEGMEKLHKTPFGMIDNVKITFNQSHFYFLNEHFSNQEIINLMRRCQIERLPFSDIGTINQAIRNMVSSYKVLATKGNHGSYMNGIKEHSRIQTCLALSRFIELERVTVRQILDLILIQYPSLLDPQNLTSMLLSKRMVEHYGDQEISMIESYISNFISDICIERESNDPKNLHSSPLDKLHSVAWLIQKSEHHNKSAFPDKLKRWVTLADADDLVILLDSYYKFADENLQSTILHKACEMLEHDFRIELFFSIFFVDKDSLQETHYTLLSHEIKKDVAAFTDSNFALNLPNSFLNIAFLSYSGELPSSLGDLLVGINKEVDFLLNPVSFDFDCFKVHWLLDWPDAWHQKIASDIKAKSHIKNSVMKYRESNQIFPLDDAKLLNIAMKYYFADVAQREA